MTHAWHYSTTGRSAVAGLLQAGDVARVVDLFVLPDYLHRGVAESLLDSALQTSKRLMSRTICIRIPAAADALADCLERLLFVNTETVSHYYHPEAVLPC